MTLWDAYLRATLPALVVFGLRCGLTLDKIEEITAEVLRKNSTTSTPLTLRRP